MPTLISSEDYSRIISQSSKPTVIEFFASWCPKCMMMEPIYKRIAADLNNYLYFYKINIDTATLLISELGIEIYPTFIVYHKGNIIGYTSGVLSENVLHQRILELVSFTKRGSR